MKKVLLFAAVVVGLGFTSCSKSECECTILGVTVTEEASKDECETSDTAAQILGGSCKTV